MHNVRAPILLLLLPVVLSSAPMTLSLYYFVSFCPSALTPHAYLNSGT